MVQRRTMTASLLRIMCALALVMLGFALKPVVALSPTAELAAYQLPDGSIPSLCLTHTGEKPGKDAMPQNGCEACRLSASIILPQPPLVALPGGALTAASVVLERAFYLSPRLYPPSSGPRAPPSSVFQA